MNFYLEKIIGLLFLIVGIYVVTRTYKYPNKLLSSLDFKGYIGGVGFIIIGIFLIFNIAHF